MKLKIGFASESNDKKQEDTRAVAVETIIPRKSVVQVRFLVQGASLAYYNDRFDLHVGDFVYVDGKMEGELGRVTEVNYNFKIKLSDYKRVIAQVDTNVEGQFHFAGAHFVTFDRHALPAEKVALWFKAPRKDDDEMISGSDERSFGLDDLKSMKISPAIAERGHEYYMENKVVYISMDGERGYAIVNGNDAYEVEFEYCDGQISKLTCSCFCSYNCKHEFAAMLQLKETLARIEESYSSEFERSGYFAALLKKAFLAFAVDGNAKGSLVLN